MNSYVDMMRQYRRTVCITFNSKWNPFDNPKAIRNIYYKWLINGFNAEICYYIYIFGV
jgi:hypothetical protein